jgi:hypothetical protein
MSVEPPRVDPNNAALELLREFGASMRAIDEKVDLARLELAEVRGAEIPEALRAVQNEQTVLKDRLAKLEEAERTRLAVARPWVAGLKEIGKALLPYAVTAALLFFGLKELKGA